MASKFVDTTAIMQVIGGVFENPSVLDFTDKYTIVDEDFPDPFHKTIFGAIYKMHELGAQKITLESISDFLSSRPKSAATTAMCWRSSKALPVWSIWKSCKTNAIRQYCLMAFCVLMCQTGNRK